MMIDPETYYEINVKGKSREAIAKKIQSLKQEINRLKKQIENSSLNPEDLIFPTPRTQLKCNREYLARAIAAYKAIGGKYTPTKAEQKVNDFDQSLENMSRLIFSIGGFFGGYETRSYTITDEQVMMNVEHSMERKSSKLPVICPYTKEAFIAGLRAIHISEWKKNYDDPYILDGTQWELDIQFSDKQKPHWISGNNAYPYNFTDLTKFLEIS